jgi:uncharacterized protein
MAQSIAMFGDIHGAAGGVARVVSHLKASPPDLIVLVGDLGSDLLWNDFEPREKAARWQASIDRILEELEPLGVPVALVPGNHDNPAPGVRPPAQDVDGRIVELAGIRLAGIGGAGPARFGLPYEWDEDDLAKRIRRSGWLDEDIDVLLCHAPPVDTGLDRLLSGESAGSVTLSELITAVQPALYVCGHIHEAVGHRMLGRTLAVNAGRLIWGEYDRIGRPRKSRPIAYQYYRVQLGDAGPESLERVRLTCTGAPRVMEHLVWRSGDSFVTGSSP